MRYCWTSSPFLNFLFILSCLDFGICLDTQQIQVMKKLSSYSSSWKTSNSDDPCGWPGVNCTANRNSVIELHMCSFGLTGNAWQIVCQLQALQVLDVSNNSLSTPSDNDIKSCTSLVSLDISSSLKLGSSLPSLAAMRKLQFLDVSHNGLGGYFGPQIQNLTDLRVLSLASNLFTGANFSLLGGLRLLEELDLSKNLFRGEFPQELVKCTNLTFLDLSFNELKGNIPNTIGNLANLRTLNLSSNNFSGVIPETLGFLRNLTYFASNHNQLAGSIPNCTNLELLDLGNNNLTGLLINQLASLPHLQVLKLPNNHLNGRIPDIPSTLSNLSYIDLSSNHLSESIPPNIFKLPKLQNLRLQDNNLTGAIPNNVKYDQSLLELQLGGNNLTGKIPAEIGSDTKLQIQVNLSYNSLEGKIPSALSSLTTLEILDLSNNQLTGEIPGFLTAMISLTLLNLSNNRLTGPLPSFRRGLNFSHTGNPNLCTAQCGSVTTAHTQKRVSAILLLAGVAVVSVIFGIGAVALFIVAYKYFRRKIEGHFIHPDSIHRLRIDFEKGVEATLDPANVFLKNKFSTYYRAVMPSGISYSVKKLYWTDKSVKPEIYRKLGAELDKQGRLRHPNILTSLAHVLQKDCAYLFYEYVHKGSLSGFLHDGSVSVLDWPSRCSIAIGVAQGLAFLHGCQQPIFHLDLTASNILLKSLTEPQIGDIELCKIIDPSKSTRNISVIAGSIGYVPPEYAYTMRVTAAGNVYSFGVILLELLTGRPPITNGMDLANWVQSTLSGEETFEQILDTRIRNLSLQIQNEMISMLKVALSCISSSPDSRPEMKTVVGMLQMIREVAE